MKSVVSALSFPFSAANSRVNDYLTLTKPRIGTLVLLTTYVGAAMSSTGPLAVGLLIHTLIGTGLVAGGGAALNQYLERVWDKRMRRTCDRPLPAGRLDPSSALVFGLALSLGGWIYLAIFTNLLTALLGVVANVTYVLVYTPLKRTTGWCIPVGAVAGAMPTLMGWAAAQGQLGWGAFVIFGILYVWQLPHFIAIAWLYREDYANAGFAMSDLIGREGRAAVLQIPIYAAILALVASLPTFLGMTGSAYLIGASALSLGFMCLGLRPRGSDMTAYARRVFRASLVYLPLVMVWMMLCRAH